LTPGEAVATFLTELTSGRTEAASQLCHEDLVFENAPLDPSRQEGGDQILSGSAYLIGMCERVEWEVLRGERVGRPFWFDDGVYADVPVLAALAGRRFKDPALARLLRSGHLGSAL
jgi:hypothetical protein